MINRIPHRLALIVVFLVVMLGFTVFAVYADPICETYWDPINQVWVTVCSGGGSGGSNGGGSGGGSGGGTGGSCTPGTTVVSTVIIGGGAMCEVWEIWHDPCTGQVTYSNLVDLIYGGSCLPADPAGSGTNQSQPCVVLSVTAGSVYCQTDWGIQWMLDANVGFPQAYLDLRPYPVTLVGWPSAMRNGGTPTAVGTGSLDYIAYGGGTAENPAHGDWQNVVLKLTLAPASPLLFFTIPTIGTVSLPDVGASGNPLLLTFRQPSHPAAGAGSTAGEIGLSELPADLPVFSGSAVSAYRLFWRLNYEKYSLDCEPGPEPVSGVLNCLTGNQSDVFDGHWVYGWKNKSMGGEITPQMVPGLPSGMAADLDGDGAADAYWNRKVMIRRMDDSNRIDNPQWLGSWSWGGAVYWAVREGQGQLIWP